MKKNIGGGDFLDFFLKTLAKKKKHFLPKGRFVPPYLYAPASYQMIKSGSHSLPTILQSHIYNSP